MSSDRLTGVVLAGGFSSRMGYDKTRLSLSDPGGDAMPGEKGAHDFLASAVALLQPLCREVLVSCRVGQSMRGCNCVQDTVRDIGPMAGIHAGLYRAGGPVLVLSCDMPFMNTATLQRLCAAREQRPPSAIMTTYRYAETHFIESLCAVYEAQCLEYFTRAMARREHKISMAVPGALRHDLLYTQAQALPFFNVNYPADLALARQLAGTADAVLSADERRNAASP